MTYIAKASIFKASFTGLFCLAILLLSEVYFLSFPKAEVMAIVTVQPKAIVAAPKLVKQIPQAHLKIPSLNVDAVIKDTGLTSTGAMVVPSNNVEVGWFGLGTRPGDIGSAVIGAHNRFNSAAGVFAHLDQLQKGDVLSVVSAKGITTSFVVRDMQMFDATDTNSGIFDSESGAHLNLVTCSGDWNSLTKSYTKRLVIFTDAIAHTNNVAVVPAKTI